MNTKLNQAETHEASITKNRLYALLGLLIILHVVFFDLRILTAPDSTQVQYTPDDAYYYLVLARNFVAERTWTFDTGVSSATGYHPLLAYILAGVYTVVQPLDAEFVRIGIVLSSAITLSAVVIAWSFGVRHCPPYFMLCLALVVSSRSFVLNSVSIMEWPLVILIASLYCIFFYHNCCRRVNRRALIVMFILGLFGSLSRSDFGILPLALLAASLVISKLRTANAAILMALGGLLGATSGLLLMFALNLTFAGQFLQSSLKMKVFWAQVDVGAHQSSLALVFSVVGLGFLSHVAQVVVLVLLTVTALGALRYNYISRHRFSNGAPLSEHVADRVLVLAAFFCVTGYLVLYSRNAGIQPWYTANLTVPVFIILVSLVRVYAGWKIQNAWRRLGAAFLASAAMIVVILNITSVAALAPENSPWPHQEAMLRAGKYLKNANLNGSVGSWNAGIIGFYEGGNVVNIDGLVNDDVYDYVTTNKLPTYLFERNIRFLVDFNTMLDNRNLRLRGGYDDAVFLDRLRPIKVIDGSEFEYWKHLTVFEIVAE